MRANKGKTFIEMSPGYCDEQEGIYANTFKVGYNAHEFVLDFGQDFSENGKEKFHTRIITNPKDVGIFFEILSESIKKHSESY